MRRTPPANCSTTLAKNVAVRLRELRILAGATQFDVERLTGVSRTRLSCAECEHIQLEDWECSAVEQALLELIRHRISHSTGMLEALESKVSGVDGKQQRSD